MSTHIRNRRNRNRGKAHEKRTANELGLTRTGIYGKDDCTSDAFSIECKARASFVGTKWLQQAEQNAKGKISFVVIHINNTHSKNDMILMRRQTLLDLVWNTSRTLPITTNIKPYVKGEDHGL